jgi:hypothetical protein
MRPPSFAEAGTPAISGAITKLTRTINENSFKLILNLVNDIEMV